MSTKDENPLVKLIKKSVGLPTGQSCGCGAAPAAGKPASGATATSCDCDASKEAVEQGNTEAQAKETTQPSGA